MVLELLLLILLLYFFYFFNSKHSFVVHKIHSLSLMLKHVHSSFSPHSSLNFQIIESTTSTWVQNKFIIHLLIWNFNSNSPFDDNTLAFAAIHELAHILCPDNEHTPLFDIIESKLLSIAEHLGYYSPSLFINLDYPCTL